MAIVEIKVPSPGESITEVTINSWIKQNGDVVEKDEVIGTIDSDKATLEITAPESGKVEILVGAGDTVKVGDTVVRIDTSVQVENRRSKNVCIRNGFSGSCKNDGRK
jgi:2-oxoglutarate dehydrogenase E2 component (dihydrolipoamide succinyltransferase)